jgi:hypothetical protein
MRGSGVPIQLRKTYVFAQRANCADGGVAASSGRRDNQIEVQEWTWD